MKKNTILTKILCTVITSAICFSAVLTGASAATTSIDINEDGSFDVSDSTHLQMHLAGYFDLSAEVLEKADADNSGSVDVGDATRIQMLLAGYTFEENTTKPSTEQPTTQKPTVEPTTAPTQDFSKFADEVIRLTNIEREKAGLNPLTKRDDMCEVAQIRSVEISEYYSHFRPNGEICFELVKEKGIRFNSLGENIACGQSTPEQAVREWMNSTTHKDNILTPHFTGIGVGCYRKGNTMYWVQFFIG